MASLPVLSYPRISTESQVMSGRSCIAGTRVRVMDVVGAWKAGVSEEQLPEYFSSRTLTLSEIHAALAYYYDHQDEIDAELAEDAALGRQAERERRFGIDRGVFVVPDDFDDPDPEIERLFYGSGKPQAPENSTSS
jgi:uncharacterized protein (DUF433 family)